MSLAASMQNHTQPNRDASSNRTFFPLLWATHLLFGLWIWRTFISGPIHQFNDLIQGACKKTRFPFEDGVGVWDLSSASIISVGDCSIVADCHGQC